MYNSPDITAESIKCTGCRADGVKIGHYATCEICKHAESKSFDACGDCNVRMEGDKTFVTAMAEIVELIKQSNEYLQT